MFWKKKPAREKPRVLSKKDIITNQSEQLGPGQSLSYRLPEDRGGGFVFVELNPDYPGERQRKYVMDRQRMEGETLGKRVHLFGYNKPKDVADWIIEQGGEPVTGVEEGGRG